MDNLDMLNEKLRSRERTFGYTVYMPDEYVLAEYMQKHVDYILFDCEHGPYDIDYYAPYFRSCRRNGIPTIVRVPDATYPHVSRAVDLGADGILVPRVETMEQVKTAVEGIFLPPDGKKGYGGKFQFYPGETIPEYRNRRILWIQIESLQGAKLLPQILEEYGQYLSACVIGPFDLSISVGTPCETFSPQVNQVIDDVFALCEKAGISSGIYATDVDCAAKRIAQGANLIWMTNDSAYMIQAIAKAAADVAAL